MPIVILLIIWSNKNWFYSSSSSYPRNFLLVHCKGTKFSIFHCTVKGSDFEQIFGRTYISKLSGPLESMCLCICHFLIFGVFLYHTSFPVNNWVLNTSLRRLLYVSCRMEIYRLAIQTPILLPHFQSHQKSSSKDFILMEATK